MRRRIIFSNYDDLDNPFYGGGGAAAIHEIAKRLAPRHDVKVLTGKFRGYRDGNRDDVYYEHIGLAHAGPRLGQIAFHFSLPLHLSRRDFDIWIESLTPPFSTACLQLFTRSPVVLLTQNLPGKSMARKYKLPFHWFESLGLKTYRYGIALSDYLRDELLRSNPRMRVAVIPNGVDAALINQTVHPAPEHILFLGRIDTEQKGLDLLFSAFNRIAKDCSVPLVIAGSGIPRDEELLQKRIQDLGLGPRVRLLGKVSGREKKEAFRRALFFVMPSRYEGFPLTLLEAFCWQIPVVLFSIPELAWLPSLCCLKIAPFDVAAFAEAMLRLLRDPSLREKMAAAAKQWVRAFSWDSLATQYENLFAEILETGQISLSNHERQN